MAKLTTKDIVYVAKLANLSLTAKEITLYQKQLGKVIDYINELDEIKTDDVVPTSQTTGLENVTRDDLVKKGLTKNEALAGSDNTYNDYFKVPITLTEKEI